MKYEDMADPTCTKEEWDAMDEEQKNKVYDLCGGKKKSDSVMHTDMWDGFDLIPFRTTPEGYLVGEAIVTNIGVFSYMNPDGSITRELRTRDEVFHPDSMNTIMNKPITNDHPSENVNVDNYKELSVGHTTGGMMRDEDHLITGLVFTDKDAIADIRSGKRGLSCGYTCDLVDSEPGSVWLGVPYDKIQKNIRYNHLALCDKGRAGDAAVIRMDSAVCRTPLIIDSKEDTMEYKIVKLDGVDYQAEAKVIETLTLAQTKVEEAQGKLDSLLADKSKIEAERDQLKEKADAVSTELEALKKNHVDADKVAEMVKARVELTAFASKIGVEVKDEMTDRDIMVASIMKKSPNCKLDGKDDVYIQARFDGVKEDFSVESTEKDDAANRELNADKKDNSDADSANAKRKAMIERQRSAFAAGQK